ncbi:MAG: hypothetical protein P1U68_02045 [Verrucomicrobiales bacterium]|nr:hypothetical protein [Verrucomicrobiales bacterium]
MKAKSLLIVSLLIFASFLDAEEGESQLYLKATDTDSLVAKEGQIVIVYGETENSAKSASGANFVNFKGADFLLVTFKSDIDQFAEGEPFELFDGKRVAVEGAISIYRGKPQIKLTSPDQVTILTAEEVFPPVTGKPEKVVPAATTKVSGEMSEQAPPEEEPKRKPPVDPSEFFD